MSEFSESLGQESYRLVSRHRRSPWRLLVITSLVAALGAAAVHLHRLARADAAVRLELTSLRHAAQEIAAQAASAAAGSGEAQASLPALPGRIAAASARTRRLAARATPAMARGRTGRAVADLAGHWSELEEAAGALISAMAEASALRERSVRFESLAATILVTTDQLVDGLVAAEADSDQIRAASRQLLLVQRMGASVRQLAAQERHMLIEADRFGRDAVAFGEVNNALLNGDRDLGLKRVEDEDARTALETIGRDFRASAATVEGIVRSAARAASVGAALARVESATGVVGAAVAEAERAYAALVAARPLTPARLEAAAMVVVALLLLVVLATLRDGRRLERHLIARGRLEAERDARDGRRRGALEHLGGVLAQWARGDLAARARDDEDLPAGLAGLANEALDTLQSVVREVRGGAEALADLTRSARRLVASVAGHADEEAGHVESAARAARDVARSLERVNETSDSVGTRSRDARSAARSGATALGTARDTLAEAGAELEDVRFRVTRVVEELGALKDLVELLDQLSDQAKLLAVNVAIQASMDGPGARALGHFSDEVQRLSDRARQGVRRMESVHETTRGAAERAADVVKRAAWRMDSAAARGRDAQVPLERLESATGRVETARQPLVESVREHTAQITEVLQALAAVQGLSGHLRDEALAAADAAARLDDLAGGLASSTRVLRLGESHPGDVITLASEVESEQAEVPFAPRIATLPSHDGH